MTDRPIVFLHGWGTHPVVWEGLASSLSNARVLPLPGYAGSPVALGLDAMTERVAEQIENNTVLVGWSLGALVAQRLAHRIPERLSHLVLIGATPCFVTRPDWPHGVEAAVFEQFAQNLAEDYASTIRRFLSLQAQGAAHLRETLAELRRRLLNQTPPPLEVLHDGLAILRDTDLRSDWKQIRVPVSLIHGQADKLAPIDAARWMQGSMPHVDLLEIAGAAHAPFLSHLERVANLIHLHCVGASHE